MPKGRNRKSAPGRSPARRASVSQRIAMAKGFDGLPPTKGAPPPSFPVSTRPTPGVLAPAPLVDRYPLVIGQSLSASYVASVFRLATTGYRQQLVDLLRELVEQDPHLMSVLQKRILSVANGRLEVVPAHLPKDHPDHDLAIEVADFVRAELDRIPQRAESFATLLWAIYYGASSAEIIWSRDADGFHCERLDFVHSRRISWPDQQSWDAHIWDQGQVYGWSAPWGETPTNRDVFGLRIADWPSKFVLFAPQLSADYPTRDGLGRDAAVWALFKRLGARGAADYLERFAKGFMAVSYSTQADGKPREATEEDEALAANIASRIGPGSGSYAVHPDSIQITPKSFEASGAAKLTWPEWIQLCNAEISKLVLGGTLGTDVGKGGGNRALGEVQERGETELEQYDATALAQTLKRDLVYWIVRLNRPDALHVVPNLVIRIDVEPSTKQRLEEAKILVDMGGPVDLDQLATDVGRPLVPNTTEQPRRAFVSGMLDPSVNDQSLIAATPPTEEQQQRADEEAAKKAEADAAAQAKAQAEATPAEDATKPEAPKATSEEPKAETPADQGQEPVAEEVDAADRALDAAIRILLTDKGPERGIARQVYDLLSEDYPAKALEWILAGHWRGPVEVPLGDVDFSTRSQWRATHDGTLPEYVERIQERGQKPVVMVKTPGNPKLVIVDGHHRSLACEQLGRPIIAYVADVHEDEGPWDELHSRQKGGSSKHPSWL